MVFDEKCHQFGIGAGYAMVAAEARGVPFSELGVIAAATFGNVVEQGRDVQQPAILEAGHQPRTERVLMCQFGHGKAPQISHHLQDVLIDGVDVEQVMLHLADDVTEGRR